MIDIIKEWQFVADAYNGTGGFCDGSSLDRFSRETDEKFDARKQASVHEYENHFNSKVSRYVGYVFKNKPVRQTENVLLEGIARDVSFRNETANLFMANFAKNLKARGVNLLLLDTPQQKATDLNEQIENRLTPYFVEILPERLTKYKLDKFGKFSYVVFSDTQDFSTYDKEDVRDIERYYDDTEWRIYDSDSTLLESGIHGFKECPVLIASEKNVFKSVGEFSQLAGLSKRLFNLDSELKVMIRGQTFSILTVWTEKGSQPEIKLGVDNALLYSGDKPPSYISSDSSQAKTYEDKITAVKQTMDLIAFEATTTSAQESGIALSLKFEGLNSSLNAFAQVVSSLERSAWDMICDSLGLKRDAITIEYAMDFAISDINADIEILDGINSIADLPLYRATKLKTIVREDLKGIDDESMNDMFEEIDNASKISEIE